MLSVQQLSKHFDGITAIKDIDFDIKKVVKENLKAFKLGSKIC